jgi:hypothetical protein
MATRDQLINIQGGFLNHDVTTSEYGTIPWWDSFLGGLTPSDRIAVYQAKQARGLTHIVPQISINYTENLGWSDGYPVMPTDYTGGLGTTQAGNATNTIGQFHDLLEEIITNGTYPMYPIVSLAGGAQSNGPGPVWNYNDPVGWTYGGQWLLASLDAIGTNCLDDPLIQGNCVIMAGYEILDGGSPALIDQLQLAMRARFPNAVIALEILQDYPFWENGPSDWTSPAGQATDIFLAEMNPNPIWTIYDDAPTEWQQFSARMLGPAKQHIDPSNDGPWYFAAGTPRGPFGTCFFETNASQYIRKQIDEATANLNTQYGAWYGGTSFCNGQPVGGPLEPPVPATTYATVYRTM